MTDCAVVRIVACSLFGVVVASGVTTVYAGCAGGRCQFIIDGIEPERTDLTVGVRFDLSGGSMTIGMLCHTIKAEFKETLQGASVTASAVSCGTRNELVTVSAHIDMPACNTLSGVITVGTSQPSAIKGHLRACEDDPDVTAADIKTAVEAPGNDDIDRSAYDAEAFVGVAQQVQARLGCALFHQPK